MSGPVIGSAYTFVVGLFDVANPGKLKSSPTLASGDFKISIDGGTFANLTTLPTLTPASGTAVKIALSAGEMTCTNYVVIKASDPDFEWTEQQWFLEPTSVAIDIMLSTIAGYIDTEIAAIKAKTDSLTFTVANVLDVNSLRVGGTVQTARDLGASVLLSSGTGTGQLKLASGYVAPNWGDVGNPTTTVGLSGTTVGTVTTLTTAPSDSSGVTTLLSRLTAARSGYLDNVNVGGLVASQADIVALNQSASRRILLTTVQQYERPESGSVSYTVEARTYDGDGAAVNADSTPTLTATGTLSGSLAANLSAATNPATGVYRWTYTVLAAATVEQIRYDVSATLSAQVFTLSAYTQVVDLAAATWTTTDATHLTAIYNKLPSKAYTVGTNNSDGDVQMDEATGNYPGSVGSVASFGTLIADIWASVTRTLTSGANIALTKGTGLLGLNDLSAAQVNTEADTALADVGLTSTVTGRIDVAVSTRLASAGYTTPLDQAGIRQAIGLATANVDLQLGDLPTNAELASALAGATMTLTSGERDAIADALMVRPSTSWEASAPAKSLGTALMKAVHATAAVEPGTVTIYRSDGTTVHATQLLTTDADAEAITGLSGAV